MIVKKLEEIKSDYCREYIFYICEQYKSDIGVDNNYFISRVSDGIKKALFDNNMIVDFRVIINKSQKRDSIINNILEDTEILDYDVEICFRTISYNFYSIFYKKSDSK